MSSEPVYLLSQDYVRQLSIAWDLGLFPQNKQVFINTALLPYSLVKYHVIMGIVYLSVFTGTAQDLNYIDVNVKKILFKVSL